MTRGWGAGEDVIEKTRLFRPWSQGQNLRVPRHDPHLPRKVEPASKCPISPFGLEGERIVSSLVGFLVFFLPAEWGYKGGYFYTGSSVTFIKRFSISFGVLIGRRWEKRLCFVAINKAKGKRVKRKPDAAS